MSSNPISTSTIAASTEAADRKALAMAFRLAERFGFHEGICNHFSVRLDGSAERYLINPYGLHWSEMTPEQLLLIDGSGQILKGSGVVEATARFIHVAGHRANLRHKAILHTHMPYATTLTMLEACELKMTHQSATRFLGRISYQKNFGGLALSDEEGERLAEAARRQPAADVTFLANHGVVVGGATVAMAFEDLYYLERACRQQVLALQTRLPQKEIPADIAKTTSAQIVQHMPEAAATHFNALCRVLEKNPNHAFVF